MRALRMVAFGDFAQSLKVENVPVPQPKAGQVLVKVFSAGINPSDAKNALGSFKHEGIVLPRTPGRDFAGEIVGGSPALIGTAVFGTGGRRGWDEDGSHAEFLLLPEEQVVPKPPALSFDQAAAVGVPYLTAWSAVEAGGVTEGRRVLITGARGAVGYAAAQICKYKKAALVIGAVRGKQSSLPPKGADRFVDEWLALEDDTTAQLSALTQGRGADVVIDTVGGAAMFETALTFLAKRGTLVEISATGGAKVSFDLQQFYRKELRLIGVNSLNQTATESAQLLRKIAQGFVAGAFVPPAEKIRPVEFDGAVAAFAAVNAGSKDKFILRPHGLDAPKL